MDQAQAKAASQASSWGVLHAASEVSKFYYSYGYRFVSTLYSKVSVSAESSGMWSAFPATQSPDTREQKPPRQLLHRPYFVQWTCNLRPIPKFNS